LTFDKVEADKRTSQQTNRRVAPVAASPRAATTTAAAATTTSTTATPVGVTFKATAGACRRSAPRR
jgi:hypothetical protein